MSPLTLESIARLAGVSRATLSRVVNESPRVREATRERVLRVIRAHGYEPNAAARALARHRSQAIGLAAHEALGTLFSHAYFPLLVQGVAETCVQGGYSLLLSPLAAQTPEGLRSIRRGGLIDGVVVATAGVGDAFLARLQEEGLPFVLIGSHPGRPNIRSVSADNLAGARMATEHLLHLGYRRIATITGPPGQGTAVDRPAGYSLALRSAGMAPQETWQASGDYTEAGGYRAMQSLLALRPRCEGVFCGNDLTALGALRAAREAGLGVPDDLAIVGFDDVPVARLVDPPLTTVRQPIAHLGARAADMLIDMLEREEERSAVPSNQVLPVELIVRRSCGACGRQGSLGEGGVPA